MLYEDYRPATWSEFVGNAKATMVAKALCNKALGNGKPFAVWIDGPSGTGKTTLANIMADAIGCNRDFDYIEMDGPACGKSDVLDLEDRLSKRSFGGGYRVVVINEAHDMTRSALNLWLTMLEKIQKQKWQVFVAFTTTETKGPKTKPLWGEDSKKIEDAFYSRCIRISLTSQGLADTFAERAKEIAEAEELGGASLKTFKRLVQDCKNNMRAVLSAVEAYEMYRDPELIEA